MKRTCCILFILFVLHARSAIAENSAQIDKLEERYSRCVHAAGGTTYDEAVSMAFLERGKVLRECAPANAPVADPFRIFIEIKPDGSISKLHFVPETEVSRCVQGKVGEKRFPPPPLPDCVIKIGLKFEK